MIRDDVKAELDKLVTRDWCIDRFAREHVATSFIGVFVNTSGDVWEVEEPSSNFYKPGTIMLIGYDGSYRAQSSLPDDFLTYEEFREIADNNEDLLEDVSSRVFDSFDEIYQGFFADEEEYD